ncbi:MAG: hypothetical protein R2991_03455 [Thermoanaerobaculia bacterium]
MTRLLRYLAAPAALILLAGGVRAADDSEHTESDFLTGVRRLTFEGRRAGEGYFSPDGKKLVFQSEREEGNPFYQIYLLDLESGDTRRISPGTGKTTCSFIQPGTGDVLFASTHLDPDSVKLQEEELQMRAEGRERRYSWDYDPWMDLFVSDAETGELTRLTEARGYDAEASYSPDGEWIVFSSTRQAYDHELDPEEQKLLEVNPASFAELYRMRADGSDLERLTDAPGYDGGPFFFPDGSRIIWRRFSEDGLTAEIYSAAPDGSDVKQLTEFGAMSWAPYVHPSGEYVLFTTNKLGFSNFEIYMVDVEGTKQPVRVTYSDGFDGLSVPTPDGTGLAWTSTRHGGEGGQIFLGRWNHEAALAALEAAPARVPASSSQGDSR